MARIKKLVLLMSSLILSNALYADVIQLDSHSPDKCRQQLLTNDNGEAFPDPAVVLVYSEYLTKPEVLQNYKAVAAEHPKTTFFLFDVDKEDMTFSASRLCLGQELSINTDTLMLIDHWNTATEHKLWQPMRVYSGLFTSKADIEKIIEVNNNDRKFISQLRKQAVLKSRHS